jgi:hypothetical protein
METSSIFQEIKNFDAFQNTLFRAVDFIEAFLPDIDKPWNLMVLTQPQRDAIDSIQFGFPLSQFDFPEIKITPRGVVMVWPRQTGKTTACAYAAASLLILIPNCAIGIIAATEKQSKKLFNKIKKILKQSIFWDYVNHKTVKVDFLELNNGSYVECWPCTDGIEGSTYRLLFVDEAAIMEEKVIFTSALPTVTHGERWIMLSTPKGPKGKFIDYYNIGLDTRPIICEKCGEHLPQAAFTVERFPIGRMPLDEMHDCPICGAHEYKYGIGTFMVPWVDPWNDGIRSKELVTKLLDDAGWSPQARQEYLGEILSEASMVFMADWIKNCTNQGLKVSLTMKRNLIYHMGVDYGRKHDASCFYVSHRDEKSGHIVLDYARSVAGEHDHQRTYKYIRKALMHTTLTFDPVWAALDATGVGDPLVEEFVEDMENWKKQGRYLKTRILNYPENNKGVIFSRTTKPKIIGNLIKKFAQGKIEIPSTMEPEMKGLVEELLRYECDMQPGTDYIKYGTQSFHDDRVIALALSVWCHKHIPSMIGEVTIAPVTFNPLYGYEEYE